VLGYVFNPLTLNWCDDRDGVPRHVVAEVHNTHGERHAYLLPSADTPVLATKTLYASPFHPVDGHYVVCAPRPGHRLDVTAALHRDNQPAFVASLRGTGRRARVAQVLRLQLTAPLAPLSARLEMWVQSVTLPLQRVPRVPWRPIGEREKVAAFATVRVDVTGLPQTSVAS
jgi:uncharacterized protein